MLEKPIEISIIIVTINGNNMYCPKCLNNTLRVRSRGVIHLMINGKKMDAGRFLFNTSEDSKDEILQSLHGKLEEFFKWYSNFQNRDPISVIQLFTNDITCEDGCILPLNLSVTVVELLFSKVIIVKMLKELGANYNLDISLKVD